MSASNWPAVTKFAPWVHLAGVQQLPEIWPTFRSQRGHNEQKHFETTTVAQIVTGAHIDL